MDKLGPKDMFKDYKKQNPDTKVTYTLYKHVISRFFKMAVIKVLEGSVFYMGNKLGLIRIKRVPRSFNHPTINWGETNKLKAQGINKHVYFTDDWWYRWYWDKSKVALKNKSVYKFSPTEGINGNKKLLVKTIKNDEFAHTKFQS